MDIPDPLGLGPVVSEHRETYPIGTRRISQVGYIQVKVWRDGAAAWEQEARVVLERHLGRPLEHNEEARRKKGVPRYDNRLEGLELWRDHRPARMPAKTKRKRTDWKGRYTAAAALLEDLLGDPAITAMLDDAQKDAAQRVLGD